MNWSVARDFKAQLSRQWECGDLLRPLVTGEKRFPQRLALRGPTPSDLTDRFEEVRNWLVELTAVPRVRIEWREVGHRVHGTQRLPMFVWIETLDDAIAMIGKGAHAARFESLLALTRTRAPALLAWLVKRPLQASELADAWPYLLDIVAWIEAHPRPGVYLRQVDIPGIHSKFIEAHRGILGELLDEVLPTEAISRACQGVGQFTARYGFLNKPARIRWRVLDARITLLRGPILPDITLDADSFARLDIPISRVFITENETNFLAFPPTVDSIVVFGAGYGWDALAKAAWLSRTSVHYWGDIDTHGFAILDHLRERFDHVTSFLMDSPTLMAHQALWGSEPVQVIHDLQRLTHAERALYDELRDNRIRTNLRLEQEMIGFGFVREALANL